MTGLEHLQHLKKATKAVTHQPSPSASVDIWLIVNFLTYYSALSVYVPSHER